MKELNADVDFHGLKRSAATHAAADPVSRLYRKGKEAKLCHVGYDLSSKWRRPVPTAIPSAGRRWP